MDSDDNAPPQPDGQRPAWRIRAIVSGAVAVVVIPVAYGMVNAANRVDPLEKVAGAQPTGAAAVARLRSHLPRHLSSAKECVQTSPEPKALATITCSWAKPHVPRTATYSLFADKAAMQESAESLRAHGRRPGPGPRGGLGAEGTSCDSADDFSTGGKTTWQSDNRERGTIWCYLNNNGEPELTTTDTATMIVASAIATTPQQAEQLLGWFQEEGQPEPSPQPTPSASSPSQPPSTSPIPTPQPTDGPESPDEPVPTQPQPPQPEPEPNPT